MSVNRVVLTGRLVADPELRTTSTGKEIANFTIAVSKRMKPQDGSPDADFFRCKAWGVTASYLCKYTVKGQLIAVDGRIETRKWTDKDGNNREAVEVVADSASALERPRESDSGKSGTHTQPRTYPEDYDPFGEDEA